MTIRNKYPYWAVTRLWHRKMTRLSFEFTREYNDDELIYSAFVRQYVAELREHVDEMVAALSEEIGDKL